MINEHMVYLDNAATTPIHPEVIEEMNKVLINNWGNPSSTHGNGRKAKVLLEKSRRFFADKLQVDPAEVFFTSGATESIYIALQNFAQNGVKHFITATTEHKAVLDAVEDVCLKYTLKKTVLDVDHAGQISLEELGSILAGNELGSCAVALMHTNNETGVLHPIENIAKLTEEHRALFFCDCVQAGLFSTISPRNFNMDALSLSAHKMYGPKGVGLLYFNSKLKRTPLWKGGSQERGMRPGTENMPGIAGFSKAFELADTNRSAATEHFVRLKQLAVEHLQSKYSSVYIGVGEAPHILHFGIPDSRNMDAILLDLDLKGICLSAGSACQSGSQKVSHVVQAMNLDPKYQYLRMSFGLMNTESEVLEALKLGFEPLHNHT